MDTSLAHRLVRAVLSGLVVCLLSCLRPAVSYALNVIITNDDGFEASTIHALYHALQAKGHSAVIVSEAQDNSGRGGAADFFRPIGALRQDTRGGTVRAGNPGLGTLPSDAEVHYVDSTPVAAVLYAIDVVAPRRWGKPADLVISGPNYGNNTGLVNNSSGTVNAALIAINRGVPAIAVSAALPASYKSFADLSSNAPEHEDAAVVIRIVDALVRARKHSTDTLLPPGVALNVNIPKFVQGNAAALQVRFSDEGLATTVVPVFSEDLSHDPAASALGLTLPALPGVSAATRELQIQRKDLPKDANPHSEQNVLDAGYVSVSVLRGNHQADKAATAAVTRLLRTLL